MFCHFAAFIGLVFPFGSLLGPLIVWQLKRESDPFVDAQGEALNFQITVALAMFVSFLLMLVVIGFFLLGLVCLAALVLTIIAGIKGQRRQGLSLSVLPAADRVGRTWNSKAGACAGFFVSDGAQMLSCQS